MRLFSIFHRVLGAFFFLIIILIIARIIYSGSIRYIFLIWNIFLAWIPFVISGYFSIYRNKEKWKQLFLFGSWLLFFPNALYIITDIIHLESTNVPLWYDAILLFASSFIGLAMAFISLQRVENTLNEVFNKRTVSIIIPLLLFIGSFGVYLGRFQRWNSWDIIHNPLALGFDIITPILFPVDNIKTWVITIIFTALNSVLYFFIKLLPHALQIKNPADVAG
ncbi:MAG TPA: DUF1361 domain-containing protein [Ferruginibacter sp.]|nr:DUF1361 domain-containing protein [Ferruginibacter sp.]